MSPSRRFTCRRDRSCRSRWRRRRRCWLRTSFEYFTGAMDRRSGRRFEIKSQDIHEGALMLISPVRTALAGQYGATLVMLQRCLQRADAKAWLAPVGTCPFWHVAYHALFITDLYLSPNEKAFQPQPFHRDDYNLLGPPPWAPQKKAVADLPYDVPTLTSYVDVCKTKAKRV